jgi:tetratricopeptide (TPR) repeat protein
VAAIAHANLAIIREAGEDYSRALEEIKIARALRPDSARILRQEGHLHLLRRDYREASEMFLRALELNPYDYESYSLLGCVMAEIGRPREAENYFQRSLNLNPDDPAARDNLRQVEERGR